MLLFQQPNWNKSCFICSLKDSMAGDVNLFLTDTEDRHTAEVEIMIAGIQTYFVHIKERYV